MKKSLANYEHAPESLRIHAQIQENLAWARDARLAARAGDPDAWADAYYYDDQVEMLREQLRSMGYRPNPTDARGVNPTRESKKIKISSRGPVSVAFADGFSADLWYDHDLTRTWILQLEDSEGEQVGPAWDGSAEYNHRRQDAVSSLLDLAEEHGGIVEVLASPEDEPRRNPRTGMRSASLYYGRDVGSQTKKKRATKARLTVMEEFYLEDAVKYWAAADAQALSKKLRDARIPLEETGLVWDLSRGAFSEFDLSSLPVALARSIVALYMKSPLTTREIEKLKKANWFLTEMLMDPEDAIAPVPEALQYEKEAIGPAKPALARELLHFYESTAPGGF